jgi:hypothetical protein
MRSHSYIAELVDHVRRISVGSHPTAITPGDGLLQSSTATVVPKAESVISEQPHFDHHFARTGDTYRYLGAEACLIKSPRRIQSAMMQTPIDEDHDWQLVWNESPTKNYELVQVYLKVIHPLFPIVDSSVRFLAPDVPADLTDQEKFSINMIYSIGCHVFSGKESKTTPRHFNQRNSLKYRFFAVTFFNRAMEYLEASTMDPTIATLRALLLFAINSLFDPRSGNIGQQVALATRLALSLEANIDSKLESGEFTSVDLDMIRKMHCTIFNLENEIASALDRPATFPEPNMVLRFDRENPAEYLCSLYRLQHRFRKGDVSVKSLLPSFDQPAQLNPGLRMIIHQTHLLINPCWGSAWHVLECVVAWDAIHIFLTPHWVYRAGCMLIQNMPQIYGVDLVQLYSNALVVLELSSRKWPSSASLSASLTEVMQHLKTKFRLSWEDTESKPGGFSPK